MNTKKYKKKIVIFSIYVYIHQTGSVTMQQLKLCNIAVSIKK